MAYVPTLEEVTGRIRDRIRQIRERVRERIPLGGQISPQVQVGGGALVSMARDKISMISAKVQELRPGILPKVAEYKPGTLVTTVLGQEGTVARGQVVERKGMAVADEAAKKEYTTNISIEV